MKFSAFLFVCAFVAIQGAVINNPEEEVRKGSACLRQSGVSNDSVKRINLGEFDDDLKLKEYLLCVSKNAGFQNQEGYLQNETIRLRLKGGHYSDDTIDDMVQQCIQQKETPEETAFQFMKCVYRNTFQKKYT